MPFVSQTHFTSLTSVASLNTLTSASRPTLTSITAVSTPQQSYSIVQINSLSAHRASPHIRRPNGRNSHPHRTSLTSFPLIQRVTQCEIDWRTAPRPRHSPHSPHPPHLARSRAYSLAGDSASSSRRSMWSLSGKMSEVSPLSSKVSEVSRLSGKVSEVSPLSGTVSEVSRLPGGLGQGMNGPNDDWSPTGGGRGEKGGGRGEKGGERGGGRGEEGGGTGKRGEGDGRGDGNAQKGRAGDTQDTRTQASEGGEKSEGGDQLIAERINFLFENMPEEIESKLRDLDQHTLSKLHSLLASLEKGVTVKQPTLQQLKLVAISSCIPFVGFGFVDNMLMILAGDILDTTLCVTLSFSTLAAAGLGNTLSDLMGVCLGNKVESAALALGNFDPKMTKSQMSLPLTRTWYTAGCSVGIVIGCVLGMFPLLFIDTHAAERMKREKSQTELFSDVMQEIAHFIEADHAILYVVRQPSETAYTGCPVTSLGSTNLSFTQRVSAAVRGLFEATKPISSPETNEFSPEDVSDEVLFLSLGLSGEEIRLGMENSGIVGDAYKTGKMIRVKQSGSNFYEGQRMTDGNETPQTDTATSSPATGSSPTTLTSRPSLSSPASPTSSTSSIAPIPPDSTHSPDATSESSTSATSLTKPNSHTGTSTSDTVIPAGDARQLSDMSEASRMNDSTEVSEVPVSDTVALQCEAAARSKMSEQGLELAPVSDLQRFLGSKASFGGVLSRTSEVDTSNVSDLKMGDAQVSEPSESNASEVSDGIVSEVSKAGEAKMVSEAKKVSNKEERREALAVPLFGAKGDVIGVMRFVSHKDKTHFSKPDQEFIRAMSSHIALEIEGKHHMSKIIEMCRWQVASRRADVSEVSEGGDKGEGVTGWVKRLFSG
eukprot:GHVN01012743.1.p1 GENE.GHVN01012743.1~~GHVN01012743.1.p1  ORF type:complete len:882 (+),score=289.23 GHVN01012743.1:35-2680(+)